MTLALPMFLGAMLVGFLVPRVLRAVSSALSPAVLLAAWLGSMASALYLALSAVLVLVWPSHAPVEGLVDGIARCFSAFAHGTSSWVGELITGTAVAVVGVIAVRIVLAGRKQAREHARVEISIVMFSRSSRAATTRSPTCCGWIIRCLWRTASPESLDLLLRRKACHPLSVEASGMLSSRTSVHT